MIDNNIKISVVIRAYTQERWQLLKEAVISVRQQTVKPSEIVLVIDHNPELFHQALEEWPERDVVVVENRYSQGSSGAWNSCVDTAKGDIIAFLDDDAVAEPDWLERLIEAYKDPNVAAVGGWIVPEWLSGEPRWFPKEFYWVVGCSYRGLPTERAAVRNLIGCNMSFRHEVIQAVGAFRTDLGHQGKRANGNEETELCIRVRQRWPEKQILHEPSAVVHHRVPAERANWRYFCRRCALEGQSKARVSHLVGHGAGLSAERAYVLRSLPSGVIRSLRNVGRGDWAGIERSIAIVVGLLMTVTSYLHSTLQERMAQKRIPKHSTDRSSAQS